MEALDTFMCPWLENCIMFFRHLCLHVVVVVFVCRDNELYWTDGFNGKIGMATIEEEEGGAEVRRGDVTFFDNIDGVKGIVAVDTDHFIGLQRLLFVCCVLFSVTVEPLSKDTPEMRTPL